MICFPSNTYNTLAIRGKENAHLEQPLGFNETSDFVEKKRTEFNFSFANITFDDFAETYKSPNQSALAIIASKIEALATIIFDIPFGLLWVTYTFCANAVTAIQTRDGNRSLASLSLYARLGEHFIGNLTKIFHETLGEYLIQEAEFHINCYLAYLDHNTPCAHEMYKSFSHIFYIASDLEPLRTQLDKESQNITLLDLKSDRQYRDKCLAFHFRYAFFQEEFEKQLNSLFELDDEVLKLLNISDFFFPAEESSIHFAKTDQEFRAIKILDLNDGHNTPIKPHQLRFIKRRLDLIENRPTCHIRDTIHLGNQTIDNVKNITIENLKSLAPRFIPNCVFALFTDEQLRAFTLDELNSQQIEHIFYRYDTGYGMDEKGCQETFALFAVNDINRSLHKIPEYLWKYRKRG